MRKSKEIANELCVIYADAIMQNNFKLFTDKISDVFHELAIRDIKDLRTMRKVSTDNGLIPIFKEQRQKYNSICKVVNTVHKDLLLVTDFDEVIKALHLPIYDWYVSNVLTDTKA